MALKVDQVATVLFGWRLKKVVKADVIQGRTGCKSGNVPAQVRIGLVGPHDHGQRIPAYQRADAADRKSTSELQSRPHLVCRLLLEKKKKNQKKKHKEQHKIKISSNKIKKNELARMIETNQ